jgi:hypothetical protein
MNTGDASTAIIADSDAVVVRKLLTQALDLLTPRPYCRACGHPLTAVASVRRGYGPVCLRRVAGEVSR